MLFWKSERRENDDAAADDSDAEDVLRERGATDSDEAGGAEEEDGPPGRRRRPRARPAFPSPSESPSRRAVFLMNATSGLCADPVHLHSFVALNVGGGGGGWTTVSSPRSLLAGAFQRCAACRGRLGSGPRVVGNGEGGGGGGASASASAAASSPDVTSAAGMLRCAACGVYAHRSCAFARPNAVPPCEANLAEVARAFGMSREEVLERMGAPRPNPSVTESSSWSLFGKRPEVKTTESTKSVKCDNDEETTMPNNLPEEFTDEKEHESEEEAGDSVALQETKKPLPDESEAETIRQQPGVIETSINLIKKTSETAKNVPKASAIGIVAGGAAGLVLAGPAGVVVGSQIGKAVLAVGAAVEGTVGISVLAMSLAAAANFHLSPTSGKNRELKLNGTLVLVRPDIAVDPVWGECTEEARRSWAEKDKELSSSRPSCGTFVLGSIGSVGSLFQSADAEDTRYKKDEDIIKADAAELPMREKVFLLVNRILNDKMSLPGYVYRHLIVKHKRRTLFGDEGGCADGEEMFASSGRLSRQDAHGVIKHVTATLLEVRPGLASSPAMTELSASAVEVLVFGELYDDVFREFTQQTEEKDEGLLAKVTELEKRCEGESTPLKASEEASISQSAIAALRSLPQARTSTGKLLHCVEFLEHVSKHFSSLFQDKCIDADTLLIMVCQHVVAAHIHHLHAEVAFIEEFSRDEQLLSGKEGYALITLQASLHYLDSLDELPSDLSFSEP